MKEYKIQVVEDGGKVIAQVAISHYNETTQAQPTSRVLNGSQDHGWYAEYVGYGTVTVGCLFKKIINVKAVYLFGREEMASVEDEGDLNWDNALMRFEVVDC